jgi:hypothetical protein
MAELLQYRKRSRKVDAEADITDCLARIVGKGRSRAGNGAQTTWSVKYHAAAKI